MHHPRWIRSREGASLIQLRRVGIGIGPPSQKFRGASPGTFLVVQQCRAARTGRELGLIAPPTCFTPHSPEPNHG